MDYIEGEVLYFNKPFGVTSFYLVNKIRYKLSHKLGVKKLKVGHAGTLDPLASGVMILCTGKATKLIDTFQYQTKEYLATIRLGSTTPSFDLETPIDKEYDISHLNEELIREKISSFVGRIEQIPPAYSACKVDGKRAYELARTGKEVILKPKVLVIDAIELVECDIPEIKLRITCSKGTYIRALARDIGETLNCGGHLVGLQRTRIGEVTLDQCLNIQEFEEVLEKTAFKKESE